MDKVTAKKCSKCHFCGFKKNDKLKYGPKYKLGNIEAHYYCVLLSNRLIQNGRDDEGMLGFLLSDIQKELQRTCDILCIYCKRGGATIRCANIKCKKSFHLPCGLKVGSSHQFMKQFKSFCHKHRLVQQIPKRILLEAKNSNTICCICQETVNLNKNSGLTLWAPCCLKNWYHRTCVQKLAHSAGYFFRCAACNDSKKFYDWMQKYGIFIPQQDASWELVPNAFEELLFRYDKCDAPNCRCPKGRQENTENTLWEIILCESCGSQGVHVGCGNLNFCDPKWECPACTNVIQKMLNKSSAEHPSDFIKPEESSSEVLKIDVFQKKRQRSCEDLGNSVLDKRKKCKTNVEDEIEIEVDVETVEGEKKNDETVAGDIKLPSVDDCKQKEILEDNHQELLKLFKPGPLSYKLRVINKVWEKSVQEKQEGSETGTGLFHLNNPNEKENTTECRKGEEQMAESICDFIWQHPTRWNNHDVSLLRDTFKAQMSVATNVSQPEQVCPVQSSPKKEMHTSNTVENHLTASYDNDLVIIKEVINLID